MNFCLKANPKELSNKLIECALEVLKNMAVVRVLEHAVTLEIRDLDETTSDNNESSAIKSMPHLRDETQVILINVLVTDSNKLVSANKKRIGWVNCRIREVTRTVRYFKCLKFGDTLRNCKSTRDPTGSCFRSGKEEHTVKGCSKDLLCRLCPLGGSKHLTASYSYRE